MGLHASTAEGGRATSQPTKIAVPMSSAWLAAAMVLGCSGATTLPTPTRTITARAPAPPPEDAPAFVLQRRFSGNTVSIAPDARLLAAVEPDEMSLSIWSVDQRALLARSALAFPVKSAPQWSRTGDGFIVVGERGLCVVDVTQFPRFECFGSASEIVASRSRTFVVAAGEGEARVLSVRGATFSRSFRLADGATLQAVADDGSRFATRLSDGSVEVSNVVTGAVDRYESGLPTFDAEGARLAIETANGVSILDLATHARIASLERAVDPSWSPSGARLAFGTPSTGIAIWDAAAAVPARVATFDDAPNFAWLGPSGLLVFGKDATRAFDASGKPIGALGAIARAEREGFWVGPDADTLVVRDGALRVLDARTFAERASIAAPETAVVGFRSAAAPVAVLVANGAARVVDLGAAPPIERGAFPRDEAISALPLVAWGNRAIAASCARGLARLDASTGAVAYRESSGPTLSSDLAPALSEDGRLLAMAEGAEVVVSDARGREIRRVEGRSAALTPDGALVFAWGTSRRDGVHVTRVRDGAALGTIDPGSPIRVVAIAPSSTLVAIQAGDADAATILVWDTSLARVVTSFAKGARAPAFRDDGHALAMLSHASVEIVDVATWKTTRSLPASVEDGRLVWSPDGSKIAVLPIARGRRSRGMGEVLDLATGRAVASVFRAPSAAFSADSTTITMGWPGGAAIQALDPAASPAPPATTLEVRAGITIERPITGDVLLARDADGEAVLVRVRDGAQLWVRAIEREGACSLFVHDLEGRFDGDPGEQLAYRVGSDLRTARADRSAEMLARFRRTGLLAAFLEGKRVDELDAASAPR